MKIQRYKRIQKVLKFYKNYGFNAPYNILIDGTVCRAALEAKVNIQEQLPKYFNCPVKLVTTQCIIMEVEELAKIIKNLFGAWLIIKQYPVHHCGHKNNRQPAFDCIKSLLKENNPDKYIVATVDSDLRNYINSNVVGVPILYLHDKSPTIELPSLLSEDHMRTDKDVASHEMETLNSLKRKILGDQAMLPKKKKKRPHHKNPLSCLKSRKKPVIQKSSGKSRKRRRTKKEEDITTSIRKVFGIASS